MESNDFFQILDEKTKTINALKDELLEYLDKNGYLNYNTTIHKSLHELQESLLFTYIRPNWFKRIYLKFTTEDKIKYEKEQGLFHIKLIDDLNIK